MAVSEFQLAMIGAGAVFVAGIWGYNKWQERKHKQLADRIFKGTQPDVLLHGEDDAAPPEAADERREPVIGDNTDERREPALPPEGAATTDGDLAPPPWPESWADTIADCPMRITFAAPHAAPALWAVQAAWAPQLSKRISWMGFEASSQRWRHLDAHDAGSYAVLVAALQLADRQGAVSDVELASFVDGVQRLADQFGGEVELPPRHEVLAHAQALDQFCASVDVQLGVNVVAAHGSTFSGTKLRGLAEAAGLTLPGDGLFHARDENEAELFSLGNMGSELFEADTLKTLTTAGVVFTLDVPRAADGPAAFDRMVAAARQMALALDGSLVDAQRHALGDETIAGIRAKIGEIQQRMAVHQIPAGSARALRLFS